MWVVAAGHALPAQSKPLPWKRYCRPDGGFCFKYPDSWAMLGEVFDGNGVVVAPQQKEDRSLWDGITLAMVAPPPQDDEEPLSLDSIIARTSSAMREGGQNFVTLQRQQRTVDHKPAQMLKAQYHEKSTNRDWIEELVFIQGPDNEVYSVALKCSPQNLARLEPVFTGLLGSWTLPEPAPAKEDPEENPPPESAPPAGTVPPAKPQP